jgi:hypothetical protein
MEMQQQVVMEFSLRARVRDEPAEEDFIQSIRGRILVGPDTDQCTTGAGQVTATLVQFGEALNYGISAERLGDGVDGYIAEYWEALCDGDFGWKAKVQNQFNAEPGDLLIVDSVEVYPDFRGRQLGIASVNRLIDVFGPGCGLVACKPLPLQFTPEFKENPVALERLKIPAISPKAAEIKLREYWCKAGFHALGKTGIYLIAMASRFSSQAEPRMLTERKVARIQ